MKPFEKLYPDVLDTASIPIFFLPILPFREESPVHWEDADELAPGLEEDSLYKDALFMDPDSDEDFDDDWHPDSSDDEDVMEPIFFDDDDEEDGEDADWDELIEGEEDGDGDLPDDLYGLLKE